MPGSKPTCPSYRHEALDIRDRDAVDAALRPLGQAVGAVVHAAAQPSHDWAAREPHTDFGVNALGTLNLLEATRRHAPQAPPSSSPAPTRSTATRPTACRSSSRPRASARPRSMPSPRAASTRRMSIDHTLHSVFGASKAAADLMVQEYGRYFGMRDRRLPRRLPDRAGPCRRRAARLSRLPRAMPARRAARYRVFGHKAKQVRDNLHARDLVEAFWHYRAGAAPGRGLQHGRRHHVELLDARGDRADRAHTSAASSTGPIRRGPHRRPHLVDQRHRQVPRPLPGLARTPRRATRSSPKSPMRCMTRLRPVLWPRRRSTRAAP